MRVPVTDGGLVERGPGVSARFQAADAGPGIGAGIEALGQVGQQVAAEQAQINDHLDQAAVKQGFAAYSSFRDSRLHTDDDAFYNQSGQNALNARGPIQTQLADKYDAILSSLTTPRQKRMFSDFAGQERSRDLVGISDYASRQAKVYDDQSDAALQYQMSNGATEAAISGDDKGFAIQIGTLRSSIRSQAARNGLQGAPAQLAEAKAVDAVYASTVERLAAVDPAKANAYLRQNEGEIADTNVKARLARMLKDPIEDQQNEGWAEFFRGTNGVPDSVPHRPEGVPSRGNWPSAKLAEVASSIPGATVTSGVRTAQHNAEVGGVPNSQHVSGTALDFVAPGQTIESIRQHYADAGAKVTVLQHDVGSGMHFHVQGETRAVGKASGKPVNAPQENDLASQLARVDQYAATNDWTFERTQGVKNRLTALANIDERLLHDDQSKAADQAWSVALDPSSISRRAIPPAIWARVAPAAQRSIMERIEHNAAPKPIANNPDLYFKLNTVSARSPDEFAKLDLRPYATQLPKADWDHFNTLQAEAIKAGGKGPKMLAASRVWSVTRSAFAGAGYGTGAKASESDKAAQVNFQRRMMDKVDAWTTSKGKAPDDNEIQAMGDNLLMINVGVVTHGWTGESVTDTPLIKAKGQLRMEIPNSTRSRIIQSYQRTHGGSMPSDQVIASTYLQNKGDLWP
jgi:hypothetical protein